MDKNKALVELSDSARTELGRIAFSDQSDAQKVFSAIWELESQVNNGGFDQYLRYTDSDVIAYSPVALKEIGAVRCCAIVERALQILGAIPADRDGREDALDALPDDVFDTLDQEFFSYPDNLTELLFDFVSRQPETFGGMA